MYEQIEAGLCRFPTPPSGPVGHNARPPGWEDARKALTVRLHPRRCSVLVAVHTRQRRDAIRTAVWVTIVYVSSVLAQLVKP